MNLTRKLTAALLFTSGLAAPVFADIETTTIKSNPITGSTETTTVRTTTVPSSVIPGTVTTSFVLPSTTTYFVIDPVTGNVIGNFDPSTGLTNTSLVRPGLVIISKDTGRVIAALDPSGRALELTVAPAFDPLVVSIDTRRANIDAMITDCLSRGVMDTAEANALRTELGRITTEEVTFKQNDNVLSYSEALQIALDLNQLQDRLKPFMPTTDITPLLGARMITSNGQIVVLDELDYRKAKLLQRIDDEYTAGRLSTQQVASLKEQMNTVSALQTKLTKKGTLSESARHKVSAKLDTVNTDLDRDVAIINDKRSKMGIKVN